MLLILLREDAGQANRASLLILAKINAACISGLLSSTVEFFRASP
jgi:hypothetical protein